MLIVSVSSGSNNTLLSRFRLIFEEMGKYWCKTCSTFVDENGKALHEASVKHRKCTSKIVQKLKKDQKDPTENGVAQNTNNKSLIKVSEMKKVESSSTRTDENVPDLNLWLPVTDNSDQAHDDVTSHNVPRGIMKRNITASEKEMKEWDLAAEKPSFDPSSSDESEKPLIKIKRRKIPRKKN
ncbi:hypothetical protein CANARDRAFT_116517 [[Candida] arabinofermentans NRRL YB-2248]|uniref:U1-type domain-containing protein n=1 Tax=[Candida] arabinofermentans NRRL YB-2248 TaxID=983967 RepID=A0A1E4T4T5_9ASCO|nr:hypothetical protein CANARDRAFT_116517 [[Candida] arabinofermentans NRRL YB-2248]